MGAKYSRLVGRANKVNRGPDDVLCARLAPAGSTVDPRLSESYWIGATGKQMRTCLV